MADTATPMSRASLAQQYLGYQRKRDVDGFLAMMSEDVQMEVPVVGTLSGKDAVEQLFRARPSAGGGELLWAEPIVEGDTVSIVGAGSPFGPLRLRLTFNSDDKLSRID